MLFDTLFLSHRADPAARVALFVQQELRAAFGGHMDKIGVDKAQTLQMLKDTQITVEKLSKWSNAHFDIFCGKPDDPGLVFFVDQWNALDQSVDDSWDIKELKSTALTALLRIFGSNLQVRCSSGTGSSLISVQQRTFKAPGVSIVWYPIFGGFSEVRCQHVERVTL